MNTPWIEKYRPKDINDVVYHKNIINTLIKLISNKKFLHMIFYGPSGTGKTSTILACAKKIYGENFKSMTLELNGSDDRGIKVIREQIKDFSDYNQIFCKGVKLIILDEVDSMTYDAQSALRRVIENYTHNTRFCLICNYITKLIPAIQSRCITLRFENIDKKTIIKKLKEICNKENVKFNSKGLEVIAENSNGDLRRAINLLQSVYMSTDYISDINVSSLSGDINYQQLGEITNLLIDDTFENIYSYLKQLIDKNTLKLIDIINKSYKIINNLDLSDLQLQTLIIDLAKIEHYLYNESNNNIQLGAFVACFIKLRHI